MSPWLCDLGPHHRQDTHVCVYIYIHICKGIDMDTDIDSGCSQPRLDACAMQTKLQHAGALNRDWSSVSMRAIGRSRVS